MGNADNVTVGKPKIGGAIYRAPLGTAIPTTADGTLDNAYKSLGYVSEDGLSNSDSKTVTDHKAWGGDIIDSSITEHKDTWKFKLVEVLNIDVLKTVYGDGNVSGTLAAGLTINATGDELGEGIFVIDMILKNAIKRVVIPRGKVTEMAEIPYKDTDLIGYDVTVTAYPVNGKTHLELIKKSASA